MRNLLFASLLLLNVGLGAQDSHADLEARFDELVNLKNHVLSAPREFSSSKYADEMRKIRDFYLSESQQATPFLVEKLRDLNQEERSHEKGPDDVDGGLEYLITLTRSDAPVLYAKYEICNLLAVLYPHVSPEQKKMILLALVDSFTPLTHGMDDIKDMDRALFRIGPDGVEGLLMLAQSDSQFVRCYAAEDLAIVSRNKGPAIDCKVSAEARSQAIEAWKKWLEENPDNLKWPTFQDYFGSPAPADKN